MKLMKLSLVAALALGGLLACSTIAMAQDNGGGNGGQKKGGRYNVEAQMERMSTELNLTDAQKPKVKAVLDETYKKMQEIPREERRDKMPALREEQSKKLKDILTPEQYEKYQAMRPMGKKGAPPAGEKKSE